METNENMLQAFMEQVWNAGNLDAVDDFVAPKYTIYNDPGDPWEGKVLDRGMFKQRLVTSKAPFPDLTFELDELLSDGDRVVVSWTMRGTNSGPIGGREASGRPIAVRGLTIYYFTDGKISGHKQVVDRLAVMQQLGMLE